VGNFRFYRRVHIFPGLSVNVSKSGPSLTFGMRGAHVTLGPGGVRKTVGIPGTGIYYTSHSGYHTGLHSAHVETPVPAERQAAADRGAQLLMLLVALGLALVAGVVIGRAFAKH
jgi:uncharacterized protein DUF4236